MERLNKIKIHRSNTKLSEKIENLVTEKLINNGFEIVKEGCDIALAIGGDGTFLRTVRKTKFNPNILYVGINTGTLGFAQEYQPEEIDNFIRELKTNDYKVGKIGVQETKIKTKTKENNFLSLNEIVIHEKNLKTLGLDIYIDNIFLERFTGEGILLATSFGSTAHNLNFGGSIIHNSFDALQITPIAPLNNKAYRTLSNSVVIPEEKSITINPLETKSILLTVDGENYTYEDVVEIETTVNKNKIRCLRRNNYDFSKKVNEKFL